ncbi:MAG: Helix-turn-helix domain protein [candidate division WS2 bacterium ADurb.Bin280]|uniref:Helix-turn-helix domain protein n=1 Tax=candidate division WS2 bacterium ADurb.Bin280 TaxID=1852829 RepID=A0A1V5SCK1_9BACT|nr:MAG: Helix-turn-helix domain protein [candidate division WS2 bacterium ADurb.Bin280]
MPTIDKMQLKLYAVFIMQQKDFYTIPEFANEIGLSRSQVFRIVKKGEIKAQRFGKLYLIPKEELDHLTGDVTQNDRDSIKDGVEKVLEEYGEVIRELGDK